MPRVTFLPPLGWDPPVGRRHASTRSTSMGCASTFTRFLRPSAAARTHLLLTRANPFPSPRESSVPNDPVCAGGDVSVPHHSLPCGTFISTCLVMNSIQIVASPPSLVIRPIKDHTHLFPFLPFLFGGTFCSLMRLRKEDLGGVVVHFMPHAFLRRCLDVG